MKTSSTSSEIAGKTVEVQTPEAFGKQLLFLLGLNGRKNGVVYIYKDTNGVVHCSPVPIEGIRKIVYKQVRGESTLPTEVNHR